MRLLAVQRNIMENSKVADGNAKGHSLVMKGKAQKDGIIDLLSYSLTMNSCFQAGNSSVMNAKEFFENNSAADLEMTFHFDHI